MYIELFLLDNLLMNLLIVRLAAALLSVRPPLCREIGVSFIQALASALAAYRFPVLGSPLLRLPLLAVTALALPVKKLRALPSAMGATLFSTFTVGGLAVAVALLSRGTVDISRIRGGVALRAALVTAAAASFLPRAARRMLLRRSRGEAEIVMLHGGFVRRFTAVIDTGDLLFEPVSGLPVAVIRCRALEKYAAIPISAETAAGKTTLYGFVPEKISVDGAEVVCVAAVTRAKLPADAVIPPSLCRAAPQKAAKGVTDAEELP